MITYLVIKSQTDTITRSQASGAKIFSSHAGGPIDKPLFDDQPDLYDIQKAQKAMFPVMQRVSPRCSFQTPSSMSKKPCHSADNSNSQAVQTNNTVIEEAERLGVRSYIFVPCIVCKSTGTSIEIPHSRDADGEGTGFGNLISIQTVAIIKAALAVRRVYSVDEGRPVTSLPISFLNIHFPLALSFPLSPTFSLASPALPLSSNFPHRRGQSPTSTTPQRSSSPSSPPSSPLPPPHPPALKTLTLPTARTGTTSPPQAP